MANRDLNREGREALTAGYYQGLINEGARLGGMNRLVTNSRKVTIEDPTQPDRQRVQDFLYYRLIPNADVPDYADYRAKYRLKTNSDGLADREYSREKPAGTRRIALVGDSITRGQGAPFQENYEALLETALTEERGRTGQGPVEIINFAVGAYSVMQMMDTAITRATPYDPDVYVVALTDRSVYRAWGRHLAQLLQADIDLKYDYLRSLVKQAGVTRDDSVGMFDAKMARYRLPTIRWSLETVRDHARARGASMLVLLIPAVDDPKAVAEEFLGVEQVIRDLDIPYLDLLDTFGGVPDRATVRVHDKDRHPNREGHRMLFEAIAADLRQSPEALAVVHGPAVRPSPASAPADSSGGRHDR
jgi:lysophospholipase L1-like esterase